jgi:hypothetical protein
LECCSFDGQQYNKWRGDYQLLVPIDSALGHSHSLY